MLWKKIVKKEPLTTMNQRDTFTARWVPFLDLEISRHNFGMIDLRAPKELGDNILDLEFSAKVKIALKSYDNLFSELEEILIWKILKKLCFENLCPHLNSNIKKIKPR